MKSIPKIIFFVNLFASRLFAQECWIKISNLLQIRFAHIVNEINGKIYIIK
jgi:hypothetical protein